MRLLASPERGTHQLRRCDGSNDDRDINPTVDDKRDLFDTFTPLVSAVFFKSTCSKMYPL